MGRNAFWRRMVRISMLQNKMMNNIDVSIMNVLKKSHSEIFNQYFNDVGAIPNPNVETRKKAEDIFKTYSTQTFDSFMQKYRNHIIEQKEFCTETNANISTQTTLDKNSPKEMENNTCEEAASPINNNAQQPTNSKGSASSQGPITSQEPASSQETIPPQEPASSKGTMTSEQADSNSISDSIISRISCFRNKKHKEEFDVLNFLKEKQRKQDYIVLDFQIQEIEDELLIINGCPGDKETNQLAKEALKKMSEYLEILNRLYSYRILNVHFEKSE